MDPKSEEQDLSDNHTYTNNGMKKEGNVNYLFEEELLKFAQMGEAFNCL